MVKAPCEKMQQAGYSYSTQKNAYRLLHASLEAAREQGFIHHNPCERLHLKAGRTQSARVLSVAEQERITDCLQDMRDAAMLLALYSGLRLGEICALRLEDVDWLESTVAVKATVQRLPDDNPSGGKKTSLHVDTPKSLQSTRTVPVPDFVMQKLKGCVAEQRRETGFLFGTQFTPAEPRTLQKRCKRLA